MKYQLIKKIILVYLFCLMFGLQGCKGSENDVQSVNDIYFQNESQNIAIQNENFDSESQNNYINEDKTELQNEASDKYDELDYQMNADMIKGISRAILDNCNFGYKEYCYYTKSDVAADLSNGNLSREIFDIYFWNEKMNKTIKINEIISTFESAFGLTYTAEDIINSDEKEDYYKVNNYTVEQINSSMYGINYSGYWIPEENKYYIESYFNCPAYSEENSTRFPVNYYCYNKCGYVEFEKTDNELGFTVVGVEVNNNNNNQSNPWNCYDYHDETDFVSLTDIVWENLFDKMPSPKVQILNDFLPVFNNSSSVRMFDSLNNSSYQDTFLTELDIESIGIGDIDVDGNNEIILSVWDDEWKILVISYIDGNYYGYLFDKYDFLFVSQNGYYYKAMDETKHTNYLICKIDISELGFFEKIYAESNINDDIYLLNDAEVDYSEIMEFQNNEIDMMIRFWNVN